MNDHSHLSMYDICSRVKRHCGCKTSVQSRKIAHPCFRMHPYTSVIESTVTLSISACVFDGRDQSCRPFCQFRRRTLFSVRKKASSSQKPAGNTGYNSLNALACSTIFCNAFKIPDALPSSSVLKSDCSPCAGNLRRSPASLFFFLLRRVLFYFFSSGVKAVGSSLWRFMPARGTCSPWLFCIPSLCCTNSSSIASFSRPCAFMCF